MGKEECMVEVVEDMDEGAYMEYVALALAQSTRMGMVGSMGIHPILLEVEEELDMEVQAYVVVEDRKSTRLNSSHRL